MLLFVTMPLKTELLIFGGDSETHKITHSFIKVHILKSA